MPLPLSNDELETRFAADQINDADQAHRSRMIREIALQFAIDLNHYCHESREKSLSITKLEECVMWAKRAIEREK